jgi:hypothetical protein
MEEIRDGSRIGALGFRPCPEEPAVCEIWIDSAGAADWPELIERVTAQARKAKYRSAVVVGDELEFPRAFSEAGFTGSPPSRPLIFDAPDELQPYLDWKGRVTQLASGKRSETINAQLFEFVASRFPSEGKYREQEVNAILKDLHLYGDHSTLRRELVDRGYLGRNRDGTEYWKTAP